MDAAGRVELVGVEWTLLRFVSDGVESVPGDYPLEITLGITHTGALSATDGCNWLSGGVEIEPHRLVAGKLMTTMRGCGGPVAQVGPLIDASGAELGRPHAPYWWLRGDPI
jgi:hypothetical protein